MRGSEVGSLFMKDVRYFMGFFFLWLKYKLFDSIEYFIENSLQNLSWNICTHSHKLKNTLAVRPFLTILVWCVIFTLFYFYFLDKTVLMLSHKNTDSKQLPYKWALSSHSQIVKYSSWVRDHKSHKIYDALVTPQRLF